MQSLQGRTLAVLPCGSVSLKSPWQCGPFPQGTVKHESTRPQACACVSFGQVLPLPPVLPHPPLLSSWKAARGAHAARALQGLGPRSWALACTLLTLCCLPWAQPTWRRHPGADFWGGFARGPSISLTFRCSESCKVTWSKLPSKTAQPPPQTAGVQHCTP